MSLHARGGPVALRGGWGVVDGFVLDVFPIVALTMPCCAALIGLFDMLSDDQVVPEYRMVLTTEHTTMSNPTGGYACLSVV